MATHQNSQVIKTGIVSEMGLGDLLETSYFSNHPFKVPSQPTLAIFQQSLLPHCHSYIAEARNQATFKIRKKKLLGSIVLLIMYTHTKNIYNFQKNSNANIISILKFLWDFYTITIVVCEKLYTYPRLVETYLSSSIH